MEAGWQLKSVTPLITLIFIQDHMVREQPKSFYGTVVAQDMFDRMRANSEEARNGNYNLDFGDSSDDYEGSSLDNADRREWLQQMAAAIPGAEDSGCGDGGDTDCGASVRVDRDGRAQITIRWVNERLDEDDDQRITRLTTGSRM